MNRNNTNNFDRNFTWMSRFVGGFIAFVFIIIICGWITMGVVGYKTYKNVDQNGIKGVVERLWNGTNVVERN